MPSGQKQRRGVALTAITIVCAALLATPLTLNHISNSTARSKLQRLADTLALSALMSVETDDRLALANAIAVSGTHGHSFSSTLKRTSADGLRSSEVVIADRHRPPLAFLLADRDVTVEVTGRVLIRR